MRILIYGAGVIGCLYATLFSKAGYNTTVRRHIAGGANCTLISALSPPRLCRTGTCRRLQTE